MGKKGATSATNASIANSINSARASGMNKAQSATMGNQSAINTYNNQLNTQQSNAYASGQDAVNNEYNRGNSLTTNEYNRGNSLTTNEYNRGNSLTTNEYNSANGLVTNAYNRANGISGVYANKANLMGNAMSSQQAEGNNQYNRTWGTIGGIAGLLTSDERLKKYKDLSSSFCSKEEEAEDDNILKYKIDISKYIGEK